MKKYIERIKKQAKDESMKTGLVILGAVSGVLIAKGVRKLTESKPNLSAIVEYSVPIVLTGGGFLLATASEERSNAKYFGYGLAVSGAYEGLKVIPFTKDILSGILGETEIPAANAFFTEREERQRVMEGFGLSALPVGNSLMQDAAKQEIDLPELDGIRSNLGYSSSITSEADDIKGIL